MLIIFVILWVLLGAIVFLLAMRRGAHGKAPSKTGQRLAVAASLLVIVAGLVVPVIVMADNAKHKAGVDVGGVRLTASEQKGRELFAQGCAVCHSLNGAAAHGQIGPNLDVRIGQDISTAGGRKALVLSAIEEGRARGLGQMPAQLYTGREAQEVSEFVAAVAGH